MGSGWISSPACWTGAPGKPVDVEVCGGSGLVVMRFNADFLRRGVVAANAIATPPQIASEDQLREEVATTVGTHRTKAREKNRIHSRLVHQDDTTSLSAQSPYCAWIRPVT